MKQMLKYNLFKKSILIVLLTIAISNLNAQTGLNFQGVARTTSNIIIASQDITLKLSILQGSATGIAEYIEIRKVKTNAQGLFTAVIGDAETISTIGNFADIDWKLNPKFLKIELDPAAGNNFITMGTTQFQYVAYAKFANTVLAENISGIVPVAKGGTGTNSLTNLKSNLSLENVNNTADSSKPISTLTQKALDLKLNIADSAKVFVTPSQMAKYSFTSDAISIDTTSIFNRINLKLSKTDTASLSNRIDLILNKIDTSSLSNRINTKLNITDTTSLLRKMDTLSLSNRINTKLNIADTSYLLSKADTLSLSNRINTKLNIADTSYLLRKTDTLSLSNRINTKLNIADTSYLLRKTDTLSLSNRINTKLNIADTSYLLSKADTLSLSNRVNTKLNIADTTSFFRKSQLGMNNGAASLDAVGKIPSVQIPAISFSSVDVVDDMSEMLALPVSRLVGSIAVRLDSSKNFVLANLPASNRANWIELIYPDAPVQTVNGLFGNVDLRKADITDLKNVDNTSDEEKPLSRATRDSLNMKLYITDTSYLLKKSDTSFLLQKVDTAAILSMYAKKFTKDVVVNFGGGSLGKYANGTTIPAKGKTLDEFLLDLVSKSVAPSFSAPAVSISAIPGASSYEIGYDPGVITLSSTFNKNDGGNATATMFYKNGSSLGTGVNTNSPGSITSSVGYSVIVNYAAGTATKNDNLGTPFPNTINAGSTSASLNFTTYSKRYWGGISAPFNTATVAEITTLSPLPNSDNSGGSRSITTNIAITGTQYAFYAYPATNADLTSIMYNNFESINTFTKTIVQIKNAQGYTQNYKVYTSNDAFSATLSSITFN
jgi:hypothetical protein